MHTIIIMIIIKVITIKIMMMIAIIMVIIMKIITTSLILKSRFNPLPRLSFCTSAHFPYGSLVIT